MYNPQSRPCPGCGPLPKGERTGEPGPANRTPASRTPPCLLPTTKLSSHDIPSTRQGYSDRVREWGEDELLFPTHPHPTPSPYPIATHPSPPTGGLAFGVGPGAPITRIARRLPS